MIKTLNEILGDTVSLSITSFFTRKLDYRIMRDPYKPEEEYKISFIVYSDELEDCETFAFMNLNIQKYADMEEAYEIADMVGWDELDAADYACRFLKKHKEEFEVIDKSAYLTICDMHNLYIAPKYRGKGLSEAIKMLIPQILFELGEYEAVVVTYINPFINQIDIDMNMELEADSFGGYAEHDKPIDKSLAKIMEKSLKKCGFERAEDKRHFVTTTKRLRELGEKECPKLDYEPDIVPEYYDLE